MSDLNFTMEEERAGAAAYQRSWRKAHIEEYRAYQRRYQKERRARLKAQRMTEAENVNSVGE